ncbi:glycosyltransferase family 4 protein [Aliifodinibius salicampi]|uniref:Glycosyltransferase family 4 protein n=1 Tax=Fodinibius salicampi TaxID=1920655 RepID=A0ABT3PWT0_9BACT|nr:glycosyltransferase [Fodinibius salicampi]MCW9712310.1 glycosyltransferase family 4 protein [Fodinibius salicampi]
MTDPSLLVIGSVWPEPDSSAAGRRMMEILSLFQKQNYEITFASTADKSNYSVDLEQKGINEQPVKLNDSSFDEFIRGLRPEVVLFDRFTTEEQFGWRVAENCPQAMRILDSEDLHCLRRVRKKAIRDGRSFNTEELLQADVAKREAASIYRCDLSLIISEYEMEVLQKVFRVDPSLLHYLPFLIEPIDKKQQNNWLDFSERRHFVTIGNFRHPPNWDAVQYLKKDIWPLIRSSLPKAELHIYGAYPSQKVQQLHQPEEGFHIKGRAEDAKKVVGKAKVMLAPLRFGAGLKGKLVEGMECGTPSVTTDIGAEGLQGNLNWPGAVENNPENFVDSSVELYTNREKWQKAQKYGVNIINKRFSKNNFEEQFITRLNRIKEGLESHRRQNFTGSMLMHHTAASTRYMSKWIEEKNKT